MEKQIIDNAPKDWLGKGDVHTMFNSMGQYYYTVEYVKDLGFLYSNWKGSYLSFDEVQKGCLLGLDKIKQYKVTKILNDNTLLDGSWDDANAWIADYWIPMAIQSGLKKFAHIVSQDIYAQLSAQFMHNNNEDTGLEMKLFEDIDQAVAWLSEG